MRDTTNAFDLTLLQHSSSESSDQSPYRLHSQTMQNNQDKAIDAPASSSESQSMVQANDDTTEKKGRATAHHFLHLNTYLIHSVSDTLLPTYAYSGKV